MPQFNSIVDGAGKGKFDGELVQDGRKDKLVFSSSTVTVGAARTETVGGGTITVGAAQAETVGGGPKRNSEIILRFIKTSSSGAEYVYYTITLTDAQVSSVNGKLTFSFGSASTSGHPPHPSFITR